MKRYKTAVVLVGVGCLVALSVRIAHTQGKAVPSTVQVHMVITDQAFNDSSEVPVLRQNNVQVKVGKDVVRVEHLIPAQGDSAALQLFVLIDDTCETTALGNNLNDRTQRYKSLRILRPIMPSRLKLYAFPGELHRPWIALIYRSLAW